MDLKNIWSRGVSIGGLLHWHPGDSRLEIKAIHPDHPETGYYLGRPYWESYPDMRHKLGSGKWKALGYRAPRKRSSLLEILPDDMFADAGFGTLHSTVTGDGLSYAAVRVVHSRVVHDRLEKRRPQGRPSLRPEIQEAYVHLRDHGLIDHQASVKALAAKIRMVVASRRGVDESQLAGVCDDVVRTTVGKLFKKEKSQKL